MSEEINFQPVFGPQELFECAQDNIVAIRRIPGDFKSTLHCTKEQLDGLEQSDFIHYPIVAMRRIIKTPAAPVWTVADQKAGLLPNIGDKHRFDGLSGDFICRFIDSDGDIWSSGDDDQMYSSCDYEATPIETPEERAQRLRFEWSRKAVSTLYTNHHDESVALVGCIYDALLSGELQSPKGE